MWQPPELGTSKTQLLCTRRFGQFLIGRMELSLEILQETLEQEARGIPSPIPGPPLAEQQLTFAEITYLASDNMVQTGVELGSPRPTARQQQIIAGELMLAAPMVCYAFNGLVVLMSSAARRQEDAGQMPDVSVPQQRGPAPLPQTDHPPVR
jgi:hypothetical protein